MTHLKPTKYYTSFLLRFISYDRFLYRFVDREDVMNPRPDLLDRVRDCMIYLICSRPIVTINPESFTYKDAECKFDIEFRIGGIKKTRNVKTPKGFIKDLEGKVEVSPYPHKSIYCFDKDGNLIVDTLISNCVHILKGITEEVSNHEVLYVGKGTADCAVDRLDGHSTLEKILADVLKNEPDKEVVILLYNFKMKKSALTVPEVGNLAEIRGEEAKKHFQMIFNYKPGTDEQTKIAEALLIDYFKTSEYNSHFSKGISLKEKVFQNVQKADFDAFLVELDNENIGYLKIFSKKIEPNYFHHAILDVRKLEGRVSLMEPETINKLSK